MFNVQRSTFKFTTMKPSPSPLTTIQSVLDAIVAAIPGAPLARTVDTVKLGDPARPVAGVAVTFMATLAVAEAAVRRGANLIITHEPTFFSHLDATDWLQGDPVFEGKRRFLEEHGLVVWRFHDYPHFIRPDAILQGMLQELGWETYALPGKPAVSHLPPLSLGELAAQLKSALGIPTLRFIGDPGMTCRRIGLAPGAPGGERQIRGLMTGEIDVLVTGEVSEWEVSEYVRESCHLGRPLALIVLGHAWSEEAGMKRLTPWLQSLIPGVPVHFLPVENPFHWQ